MSKPQFHLHATVGHIMDELDAKHRATKTIKDLSEKVASLTTDNNNLTRQLAITQAALDGLRASQVNSAGDDTDYQDEIDELSDTISDLKDEIGNLESAHDTLVQERDRLQRSIAKADKDKDALIEELRSQKYDNQELIKVRDRLLYERAEVEGRAADYVALKENLHNERESRCKLWTQLHDTQHDFANTSQALHMQGKALQCWRMATIGLLLVVVVLGCLLAR